MIDRVEELLDVGDEHMSSSVSLIRKVADGRDGVMGTASRPVAVDVRVGFRFDLWLHGQDGELGAAPIFNGREGQWALLLGAGFWNPLTQHGAMLALQTERRRHEFLVPVTGRADTVHPC